MADSIFKLTVQYSGKLFLLCISCKAILYKNIYKLLFVHVITERPSINNVIQIILEVLLIWQILLFSHAYDDTPVDHCTCLRKYVVFFFCVW